MVHGLDGTETIRKLLQLKIVPKKTLSHGLGHGFDFKNTRFDFSRVGQQPFLLRDLFLSKQNIVRTLSETFLLTLFSFECIPKYLLER